MSDGEVGKSTYRRIGELSGRGYSPTGGFKTWTTTGSQQVGCRTKNVQSPLIPSAPKATAAILSSIGSSRIF